MELPRSSDLNIQYLSRLFDSTSECYKFFWFQAILTKVLEDRMVITYDELVNEMILEAWYMVTEYHLNLGPKDTLEALIHYIQSISGMRSAEKRSDILSYLQTCSDREVLAKKKTLTNMVPYRLQAPFMSEIKGSRWDVSRKKLMEDINQQPDLIYYFGDARGMQTSIYIQKEWYTYFHENQEILKGWLQYNMILYLQKRNPSVPGIADKLSPPEKRNLGKAVHYWKVLLERHPIRDIYGHVLMDGGQLSIDHFVPWSYVAHDEFWNLHPTTKSINSQKSNHLPKWDVYFPEFAHLKYFSYEMVYQDDAVKNEFRKCEKDYLNNFDIERKLYREGQDFTAFANVLEEVIHPVYQSAENCGFTSWVYRDKTNE